MQKMREAEWTCNTSQYEPKMDEDNLTTCCGRGVDVEWQAQWRQDVQLIVDTHENMLVWVSNKYWPHTSEIVKQIVC